MKRFEPLLFRRRVGYSFMVVAYFNPSKICLAGKFHGARSILLRERGLFCFIFHRIFRAGWRTQAQIVSSLTSHSFDIGDSLILRAILFYSTVKIPFDPRLAPLAALRWDKGRWVCRPTTRQKNYNRGESGPLWLPAWKWSCPERYRNWFTITSRAILCGETERRKGNIDDAFPQR